MNNKVGGKKVARRRPRQHTRRVKTKAGRKRVTINRGIRPKIKISERKIFNHLSNPKKHRNEYGGAIDFDKKGRIEQVYVIPGKGYEVSLPTDYEVIYHTHPDNKPSPPTTDDVIALLEDKKQQAEIIFRNGQSFTIIKTPASRALSKLPATQLRRKLDKAFFSSNGPNWEQKYAKELEKMGFKTQINKQGKTPIHLNIKIKEPGNKK